MQCRRMDSQDVSWIRLSLGVLTRQGSRTLLVVAWAFWTLADLCMQQMHDVSSTLGRRAQRRRQLTTTAGHSQRSCFMFWPLGGRCCSLSAISIAQSPPLNVSDGCNERFVCSCGDHIHRRPAAHDAAG